MVPLPVHTYQSRQVVFLILDGTQAGAMFKNRLQKGLRGRDLFTTYAVQILAFCVTDWDWLL
jgi:hypothetical protein